MGTQDERRNRKENFHFDYGQPLKFSNPFLNALRSDKYKTNVVTRTNLESEENGTVFEGCGQHSFNPQERYALLNLKGFSG